MPQLEVTGLTKRFGDAAALADFSHPFADGKITTVLGPSGSGKSTLLGLLAGLIAPDAGAIFLDKKDITRLPAEKRDFGLIFQNYALFPHLSVEENVAFGLRVRGVPAAEREQRVRETLDLARIPHLARRRIHQISGGEQQRVALARALAFRPRLLLMDEPLSALDARLRDEIRGELLRLLTELAITTVYVTHDQVEAMTLAHEVVILNQGRIEQTGQPIDVYRRPQNRFVANFLGHANIFPVTCDGSCVRLPFAAVEISSAPIRSGQGTAMFRPEDVEIVDQDNGVHFTASVESCAFLGDRFRIELSASGARIFAETKNHLVLTPGARVGVRLHPQKLVLWAETGNGE